MGAGFYGERDDIYSIWGKRSKFSPEIHRKILIAKLKWAVVSGQEGVKVAAVMIEKGERENMHLCRLEIYSLRYIPTPSVAKIVVNLQELILTCCQRVEEVINMEDEEDGSKIEMMDKVVLPQLHALQLQELDNITSRIAYAICATRFRNQNAVARAIAI
ncbi:hypothetical protein LguiB_005456 [Lonicera macranthoides]